MSQFSRFFPLFPAVALLLGGCVAPIEEPTEELEEPFSSDIATLMNFEFDGELASSTNANPAGQIRAQLLYTVGHLNANNSVARLGNLTLTGVTTTSAAGVYRIKYHAKLPVAWGSKANLPASYALALPMRLDDGKFFDTYARRCSDEPGSTTTANFWYHYRPRQQGCALATGAAMTSIARVTVSTQNTVAKYPEYQRVWEDDELAVVAVFGKYEVGGGVGDAGVDAYNEFISTMNAEFSRSGVTTTPAALPATPSTVGDVTFKVALPNGRSITLVALLVDVLSGENPTFDRRYAELTPGADLIIYSGHAGLGANVRSLANKGRFFPGKYQAFFINGCDTEAYVDNTLATRRAALNADDPSGTKYMDIVTNVMPAYFVSMPNASMQLVRALANPATPKTYNAIFKGIDPSQVVVVNGEQDNTFNASYTWPAKWRSRQAGTVSKGQTVSYSTEILPAGSYVFTMTPDVAAPGGDADLHVRVGDAPTLTSTYKCPSYLYNSNERCSAVTLSAPARIFYSATGDKTGVSSGYVIRAFAR